MLPPSALDDEPVSASSSDPTIFSQPTPTAGVPVPQVEEAAMVMEDNSPPEAACVAGTLRNLLAWSIAIPNIHSYEDELKRDKVPVFCIHVERNDRKQGEESPWQRLTEDAWLSLECWSALQSATRRRAGPSTDDIWNSTSWSPGSLSSTVTFDL